MNDWWKAPVLQGEDNDYGQYDYLIEELPHDYVKWQCSKYAGRCDSCGKERHLLLKAVHYFYTLDGYDYMDNSTCWRCHLEEKMWVIIHKLKKKFKIIKDALRMTKANDSHSFIYWYKLAKLMNR